MRPHKCGSLQGEKPREPYRFEGHGELANQRRLIARLGQNAPPMQWAFPTPARKIGRNERCFCGSGKKFKLCHGNQL
ncbi:SEC-C metal-binding domain-containing protein [Burkholderia pyrrocinia]|uniref:SEC-C metal-binding domain-containing protein n=1 Tax=Burkholderia pyrrocinia TaxID=60550 RepID=UPI001ABB5BD7